MIGIIKNTRDMLHEADKATNVASMLTDWYDKILCHWHDIILIKDIQFGLHAKITLANMILYQYFA